MFLFGWFVLILIALYVTFVCVGAFWWENLVNQNPIDKTVLVFASICIGLWYLVYTNAPHITYTITGG